MISPSVLCRQRQHQTPRGKPSIGGFLARRQLPIAHRMGQTIQGSASAVVVGGMEVNSPFYVLLPCNPLTRAGPGAYSAIAPFRGWPTNRLSMRVRGCEVTGLKDTSVQSCRVTGSVLVVPRVSR